jgi:hypothetical protein
MFKVLTPLFTVLATAVLVALWVMVGMEEVAWSLPIYLAAVLMIQDAQLNPVCRYFGWHRQESKLGWRLAQAAWWVVLLAWMYRSTALLLKL